MTTPRGLDKADEHVSDAEKRGGKILFGGKRMDIGGGYFFEPTIILNAHKDMLLAQEETFAPICAFFPFDTEAEAVEAANATSVSEFATFKVFFANQDQSLDLLRIFSLKMWIVLGGFLKIWKPV